MIAWLKLGYPSNSFCLPFCNKYWTTMNFCYRFVHIHTPSTIPFWYQICLLFSQYSCNKEQGSLRLESFRLDRFVKDSMTILFSILFKFFTFLLNTWHDKPIKFVGTIGIILPYCEHSMNCCKSFVCK